jgi:hypothetical protein
VALPLHYMGHFNYDWVSHLGPIYVGTIIYVVGSVVALIGLIQSGASDARPRDTSRAVTTATGSWHRRSYRRERPLT